MKKAIAAGAVLAIAGAAAADGILTIDLTVENEVTITASDGASTATVSGSDTTGVYFENFYGVAGNSLTSNRVSGDITNFLNPADGTPEIFRGGGGADPGLNLWSWSTDFTVDFVAGTQAFQGSGTWTLTDDQYADMIAGGNRGGTVWFPADTEDDIPNATSIGTYKVIVPAPGAFALLGLGGLAAARRRR